MNKILPPRTSHNGRLLAALQGNLGRRFAKKALAALAVSFSLMAAPALACTMPDNLAELNEGMAKWTNAERVKGGLNRLAISERLNKAAQFHACNMAKRDFFDHDAPGGPTFKARVKRQGYRLSTAVENLGRSTQLALEAPIRMWKNSPKHYVNTVNPALQEMGFGVATDNQGRAYYVFIGAAPR